MGSVADDMLEPFFPKALARYGPYSYLNEYMRRLYCNNVKDFIQEPGLDERWPH
jgi:hypothetical protein